MLWWWLLFGFRVVPVHPIGFHLAVAHFIAKFNAVALLQLFRHFTCNENPTIVPNTISNKGTLKSDLSSTERTLPHQHGNLLSQSTSWTRDNICKQWKRLWKFYILKLTPREIEKKSRLWKRPFPIKSSISCRITIPFTKYYNHFRIIQRQHGRILKVPFYWWKVYMCNSEF